MPEGQGDNAPEHAAGVARQPTPIDLPSSFGKYFLTEKLATGGMAEIYLAKIVGPGGFEKPLVIKQIHPNLSGQRHFVDLFVAEAKTLVTLAHGNIVPVYELGVIDDTYFIAMEYIDGPTLYRLTEIVRRRAGRMDPPIAAWITARILEGLDYAHRKGEGVIHRDLSPRNVMLSRDGEVKLVDFGIAVTLGTGGDDPSGESAPTGSFPYMSPEQVRKQPLTVQTDLFSVGVLFWEMLVGRRLFARSDPDATLHAVIDGDIPRPSASSPDLPAKLDDVVMRALERDTATRWATAGDMLAALQRYLYSLDAPPGPRDLTALVAKYCPPETRRFPTHHDPDTLGDSDSPDATQPRRPGSVRLEDELPAGPRTAVIPRDGNRPLGKAATRARTETFATNVDLEHILERATALPVTAAGDRHAAAPPGDLAITIRSPDAVRTSAPRARSIDGRGLDPAGSAAEWQRGSIDDVRTPADAARESAPRASTPRITRASTPRMQPAHDAAPSNETDAPADAAIAVDDHRAPVPDQAAPRNRPSTPPPVHPLPSDPPAIPGRTPPSRGLLIVAGLGATALAIASVFVFIKGREAIAYRESLAGDASLAQTTRDFAQSTRIAVDAGWQRDLIDAASAVEPRSAPLDASTAPADAAHAVEPPLIDAGGPAPHDARSPAASATNPGIARPRLPGTRPPVDGPTARTDPPPRAAGTATLSVGADPWGNVILDGKRIGRTPIEHLAIPAGRHAIEVTFSGEDPPRTLKYTVDLGDGETKNLQADFTKP